MRVFRFSVTYLMWLFAALLVDHYLPALRGGLERPTADRTAAPPRHRPRCSVSHAGRRCGAVARAQARVVHRHLAARHLYPGAPAGGDAVAALSAPSKSPAKTCAS